MSTFLEARVFTFAEVKHCSSFCMHSGNPRVSPNNHRVKGVQLWAHPWKLKATTNSLKADLCLHVDTIYTIDILNGWSHPGGQWIQYRIFQVVPATTRALSSGYALLSNGSSSEVQPRWHSTLSVQEIWNGSQPNNIFVKCLLMRFALPKHPVWIGCNWAHQSQQKCLAWTGMDNKDSSEI